MTYTKVICGDCIEVMRSMPDASVDAIVTDPPYGIAVGAAFVRKGLREVHNGSGAFNQTKEAFVWIQPASRLLRPGGHVAFFIDRAARCAAEEACRLAGLSCWMTYYVAKIAPPPTPRPTFVSAVEECLIAEKKEGARRWYGGGYVPNHWAGMTPNRLNASHGHPTEKPLEPIRVLARALCPPNGLILDPFGGSGTTAVACIQEGFGCALIERESEYCRIAEARIARAREDVALFNEGSL